MTQSAIKPFHKYVKIQGIYHLSYRGNGLVVRSTVKLGNIYNQVAFYYNTNIFKILVPITGGSIKSLHKNSESIVNSTYQHENQYGCICVILTKYKVFYQCAIQ